ncbi:MAG: UDP-N-acetylmuramate--L-alanine ligase [Candidatus Doudnabacteria bacterium]|nr:UDP-N-acetylmuramate--L-alanine ligase [Candidatus Doudnabacteria bacterium]
MNLPNIKSVYLIGVGGIGMSALARLFLMLGKQVSGSDQIASSVTKDLEKAGIKVNIGHKVDNLAQEDMVIFSEAITDSSPGWIELNEAREKKLKVLSYAKALGLLMEGHHGIAVSGTNGKSTTTALLGLILEAGGLDPTVVVGSQIFFDSKKTKFQANARLGKSKYFVAEADEYHRHMLDVKPELAVLTNIELDHLDYYKNLAEIKSAFADFVKLLPPDGMVIYNADDHETVEAARQAEAHKYTYGIHHYADLQAIRLGSGSGKQKFELQYNNEILGEVKLRMPGRFNVLNALAAALAALKLGVKFDVIKKTLEEFRGIWRRFELVGEVENTKIISDYAHHPTAVKETILACQELYPDKKILTVFQPHQKNRTQKLFAEFVDALSYAPALIIAEIYEVAGREHGEKISSKDLIKGLERFKINAAYAKDLAETEKKIREKLTEFDVVLIMGAGDVDEVARRLVS